MSITFPKSPTGGCRGLGAEQNNDKYLFVFILVICGLFFSNCITQTIYKMAVVWKADSLFQRLVGAIGFIAEMIA